MDLRSLNLSQGQLDAVRNMIVARKLAYQPIIFTDDLEVGEGWVFEAGANHSPRTGRVYWGGQPDFVKEIQVSQEDRRDFSRANADLREWYEDNVRLIAGLVDDVAQSDFLELGCNSGYFLHRLAQLGSRRAIGLDYAYFGDVFEWFNSALGTQASFIHAAWDSTTHRLVGTDIPDVDVGINISVTCHVADPLHLLAYLCHKARKAVFFMVPLSGNTDVSITFVDPPNFFQENLRWPASFDSGILLSEKLVLMALAQCGFEDISQPKANVFAARRTGPGRSIYGTGETGPLTMPVLLRSVNAFNILKHGDRYYGLPQALGPVNLRLREVQELPSVIRGNSEEEVESEILRRSS
jgi:SAM-dependent methyltransferase